MGWFTDKKRLRQFELENSQLRQENAQLRQDNTRLQGQMAALESEKAQLLAQLAGARKNSSNSSKPPSSDIVKPPAKRRQKGKRRRGGQPGHPRQERALLPPEQVDHFRSYQIDSCPVHGTPLTPSPTAKEIMQQAELVLKPVEITQHELRGSWCARCQQWHWPQLPAKVKAAGLMGPRLTALAGYVKSKLHVSYTGVADFFDEVLGFKVCRGYLTKVLHQQVSEAVAEPVNRLATLLPEQALVNVDETGHKDQGDLYWTWCFRAKLFVYFKIAPSRSSAVLIEVLGVEFDGVLGCDFFSAYRKYMGQCSALVQFCLAHLIRELKFLCEHPNVMVQAYGQDLLRPVRRLFAVIHQKEDLSLTQFQQGLEKERRAIVRAATQTQYLSPVEWVRRSLPAYRNIETMADRFRRYGEQYFTFITTPGVDPTNNSAEQAIRFVVHDRRITQGTRGENGQRYCERMWTVIGTHALQGRPVFEYLVDAVTAFVEGKPAPSLLPANTS
jgi:transposase